MFIRAPTKFPTIGAENRVDLDVMRLESGPNLVVQGLDGGDGEFGRE
jgi:hypothetical protein